MSKFWSLVCGFATSPARDRLGFLVGPELLRSLLELFEQPAVITRLIDGCLQFLAQLGQPRQPLLVRQLLIERVFHGRHMSAARANW